MQYKFKPELKKLITANGRSYSAPIQNADGTINHERSRRVEIKFRLKEEEALQKIQDELDKRQLFRQNKIKLMQKAKPSAFFK